MTQGRIHWRTQNFRKEEAGKFENNKDQKKISSLDPKLGKDQITKKGLHSDLAGFELKLSAQVTKGGGRHAAILHTILC